MGLTVTLMAPMAIGGGRPRNEAKTADSAKTDAGKVDFKNEAAKLDALCKSNPKCSAVIQEGSVFALQMSGGKLSPGF